MEFLKGQINPEEAAQINLRVRNLIRNIRPEPNGEFVVGIAALSYYRSHLFDGTVDISKIHSDVISPFSNAHAEGRLKIIEPKGAPLYVARLEVDSIDDINRGRSAILSVPDIALSPNQQFIIGANLDEPTVLYTRDAEMSNWSVHLDRSVKTQ